jgi:hypothetical protein
MPVGAVYLQYTGYIGILFEYRYRLWLQGFDVRHQNSNICTIYLIRQIFFDLRSKFSVYSAEYTGIIPV